MMMTILKRKPTVYGYLRMSTNKQADSIETQKQIIIDQAKRDGHEPSAIVWITDSAVSAGTPLYDRKGGKELSNMLKPGDYVYVSKLDRAFRRASDCASVMDKWQRLEIRFCVVNLLGMAIDLSSPIGKFIVLILAAVAELEREFVRERTRDGLANRKRKGHATGKYAGYGFTWRVQWDASAGKRVKVKVACPDERQVMRQIVQWRFDNYTWEEIRDHLFSLKMLTKEGSPWSISRIQRAYQAELDLMKTESKGA
jgi:DNA invertase Pin-like site-specific DNA recombinase